jgi:hypothetical protein
MSHITQIPRGSDITVEFTITDSTSGDAIDLTNYPGIAVFLYQCGSKQILKKYSRVVTAGYGTVTVTNATSGIFEIYVPRSITQKLNSANELRADIKLRRVDASGESGVMYSVASDVVVDLMKDSVSYSETVP